MKMLVQKRFNSVLDVAIKRESKAKIIYYF